jgi:hypothetical protein
MRRRLPRAEIARRYENGECVADIGQALSIRRGGVRRVLDAMGYQLPRLKRIDVAEAVRLYRSGLSLKAVAKELGCSHPGIWCALKRSGTATRAVGGPRKHERHAEIERRLMGNELIKTIAADMGVSHQAIHYIARLLGIAHPMRVPADLDDEAVEVFFDGYYAPNRLTVTAALALAYEDMEERGVRRAA